MKHLIISTLLLFNLTVTACIDYDTPEMLQLILFRAQLLGMDSKSYFYYTPDLYYRYRDDFYNPSYSTNYDFNDRIRNIREWQLKVGSNIPFNDVYDIVYNTGLSELKGAYLNKELPNRFKKNHFIQYLTKRGNETLMRYLIFSKEMESLQINYQGRFETWDTVPQLKTKTKYYYDDYEFTAYNNNYKPFIKKAIIELDKTPDTFLKERYAFQLCRMYYYSGNFKACIETYNTVFKDQKKQSLMQIWSRYFMGISLPSKIENYYYISLTQHDCDSKDLVCGMRNIKPAQLERVLNSTKNQQEKAYIFNNYCLTYTPPAFSYLEKIFQYDKSSNDLPFLILREINKVEDWLYTPYSNTKSYNWSSPYSHNKSLIKDFKAQNLKIDEAYLAKLTNLITKIESVANQKNRDFYCVALSHLYLLQEKYDLTHLWLNNISSKANNSIKQQEQVDKLLLLSKTGDIDKAPFQQLFMKTITLLENANNKASAETIKLLYSINYCIAKLYEKNGNGHIAAQLLLHADTYKEKAFYSFTDNIKEYSYWQILYYDEKEDYNALVKMIALLQKKQKNEFENYLLQYALPVPYYYDVLGTIAFRQNKLELAYQYFSKIQADFWKKNKPYSDFLNQNPYTPKCLILSKNRKYNYTFNKAALIKNIIDLKTVSNSNAIKKASSYKKLGDIYFNCSQGGNAWMMTSYFNGYNSSFGQFYSLQNLTEDRKDNTFKDKLNQAKKFYKLAYQTAGNDKELKAYLLLMLGQCERFKTSEENQKFSSLMANYFSLFLKDFTNTKTYKQYYCPLMNDFIGKHK